MLPSLTTAFLLGLLSGSLIPMIPFTMVGLLVGVAIGSSLLERTRHIESRQTLLLYLLLLAGALYWTLAVRPSPSVPSTPNHPWTF